MKCKVLLTWYNHKKDKTCLHVLSGGFYQIYIYVCKYKKKSGNFPFSITISHVRRKISTLKIVANETVG
jgi:hypothetical protein